MTKPTLTLSALYLAAVGLALVFVPRQFGVGAVPADASGELIALLRLLGGPLLGIATLNWLTREAPPSPWLRAVLAGNLVGFGTVAANECGASPPKRRASWRKGFSRCTCCSRARSVRRWPGRSVAALEIIHRVIMAASGSRVRTISARMAPEQHASELCYRRRARPCQFHR